MCDNDKCRTRLWNEHWLLCINVLCVQYGIPIAVLLDAAHHWLMPEFFGQEASSEVCTSVLSLYETKNGFGTVVVLWIREIIHTHVLCYWALEYNMNWQSRVLHSALYTTVTWLDNIQHTTYTMRQYAWPKTLQYTMADILHCHILYCHEVAPFKSCTSLHLLPLCGGTVAVWRMTCSWGMLR